MYKVSGRVSFRIPHNGVGFVQQDPWLQQGTIRDNIVYGKMYQATWYKQVIEACALTEDFELLEKGDKTEVGDRGAMLSGGQKARVALARAVYQDKEVYLIDDIFSALDYKVGQKIYRKCLKSLLKHKTKVLVTHHLKYLANATTVIQLEDGSIKDMGPAHQILSKMAPKDQLDSWLKEAEIEVKLNALSPPVSPVHFDLFANETPSDSINDEVRESGAVSYEVYYTYLKAVGAVLSPMILLSLILMEASKNATDIWLAHWVNSMQNKTNHSTSMFSEWESFKTVNDKPIDRAEVAYYLEVYGGIAMANCLITLLRAFLFAYGGLCAARAIHSKLTSVLVKGKMSFFDSTPKGKLAIKRFYSTHSFPPLTMTNSIRTVHQQEVIFNPTI